MSAGTVRLGTRASRLARTQAQGVADALTAAWGRPVELVDVTTRGDVDRAALTQIGGTGVFVSALREALLAGEVDVAVHSLKDLPTQAAPGIALAAVPGREDPRDALVSRGDVPLAALPPGARVGTGSPRRAAQLRALGLGLEVVDVRGNVDTRIGKVTSGHLDAVVLARAGLARLGRLDEVAEALDPLQMMPAPGQGALACECREDDEETTRLLAALDDAPARAAVTAERALLGRLEAGCAAPVGGFAEPAEGEDGPELYLRAVVATVDGTASVRLSATGPLDGAEALGRRLAGLLLDEGAAGLMGGRVSQPETSRSGAETP